MRKALHGIGLALMFTMLVALPGVSFISATLHPVFTVHAQNSQSLGSQGPRGFPGARGPAGTITLGTVSTGEPGSSAAVQNVGTPNAAVLNITIPRGSAIFKASGAPVDGTGANGDYYIDLDAGRLYGPKAAGHWDTGSYISMQGTPGPAGPAGIGADLHCNTDGSGNMNCGKINGSVGTDLLVTAYPYLAKCDGSTIDTIPIANAFADSLTTGKTVVFPAGTCVTDTIQWKGQSWHGAGIAKTYIRGLPGKDVLAMPDSAGSYAWGVDAYGVSIQVDVTSDVSGPSGPFPNRVAGTVQGLTAFNDPISPGGGVFYAGCGATTTAGSNTIVINPCGVMPLGITLANIPSSYWTGAPITIVGAGASGGLFTSTIATKVSGCTSALTTCTITTVDNAATAVTNAAGTWLNANAPPWYIGNVGIALPCSNGNSCGGANNWKIHDIEFDQYPVNSTPFSNHAGAIFSQAQCYACRYSRIWTSYLYAGYIEVAPYTGHVGTNDTSAFEFMDFHDMLPWVSINGNNRNLRNVNFYAELPLNLGPFFLTTNQTLSGNNNWTINSLYLEGSPNMSGEWSRFMSGAYNVTSPSFGTGLFSAKNGGSAYVEWNAFASNWDGGLAGPIHVNGNFNNFRNTTQLTVDITDNGHGNSFEGLYQTGTPSYQGRRYYFGPKAFRDPVNKFDGSYLLSGNSATPYFNASDLVTTPSDWAYVINPANSASFTYVSDPTGSELSKGFAHSAGPTTILELGNNGGATNIWSGAPRLFGTNVPLVKTVNFITGRCVGAATCSTNAIVKDGSSGVTLGSGTLNFTSTFSAQPVAADFTTATPGDILDLRLQSWVNTGTNYDIAMWSIQPVNVDLLNYLAANGFPLVGGTFMPLSSSSGKICNGTAITAGHMLVGTGTNCEAADGGAPPVVTPSIGWGTGFFDLQMANGTNVISGMPGTGSANLGTASAVATTATAPSMVNSVSAASSGSNAGWTSNNTSWGAGQPIYKSIISFSASSDYSSSRIWIGPCRSCSTANLNADAPALNMAMISYSTVRGDSAYQCVSNDGTTQTITPITGAVPSTTPVAVEIDINASSVVCKVGGNSATITTHLPSSTTSYTFWTTNITQTSSAVNVRSAGWYGYYQNRAN